MELERVPFANKTLSETAQMRTAYQMNLFNIAFGSVSLSGFGRRTLTTAQRMIQ